VSKNIKIFG
jgi:pimeloyl-ACP methyl ester carboxylesterase